VENGEFVVVDDAVVEVRLSGDALDGVVTAHVDSSVQWRVAGLVLQQTRPLLLPT